jgi:hypothetical protein
MAASVFVYAFSGRTTILLAPLLICICCGLLIAIRPLFAASFVLSTLILTAIGLASLLPILLLLLIGGGGSGRSREDSLMLYSLLGCWIANALALTAAVRYAKVLWSLLSQEEIIFGCLGPLLFVLLLYRNHL